MSGPWEEFQGPWSDFKPVKKAGPWNDFAKAMSAESELAVAGSGTAAALAAGAVAFPASGIAGAGALNAGGGPKEVYEAMEATNKAISPELTPTDEEAVRKLMYPLELLNKGATAAQEYVTEKTGSKIAGATVGTGIEAGALLLGPKAAQKVKSGAKRVVTDFKELKGMEGPWAEFKTPDMARTAKPWEEFKAEEVTPVEEVKAEPPAEVQQPTEPPTPAGVEPTSAKNAVTTAERGERGLDPVESEARRTTPMYEEGKRLVDSGERDPRALAKSIIDKPRDLTPEETGALVYDRMRLKNEHKATMDAVEKAIDSGDTVAEAELRSRLEGVEDALDKSDTALKRAGTEWSATGRMRQMLVAQDYSLAAMVQRHKVKTGKAPSPEMRTKMEGWAKQIEDLTAKLKEKESKIADLEAARTVEKIKADTAREQRQTRRVRAKQELSVEFDSLVKELNKTLGGQLNVGLDPTAVVIIGKMAKNRVQAGYITAEALVDHIYTAIKKTGIEVSKRDIRDAISGYGQVPNKATKGELTARLNELKKEMRRISKAEDAQSGKIDPDAARQKAYKTRTANQIKDLERRLKEGDFSKKTKREIALDPEALELKFQRDKVIKQYNEALIKEQMANRTKLQKAGGVALESVNLIRSMKTSMDLSAVLRQGALIVFGHPIRGIKAMPAMFKALKSEKGQFAVDQEILHRPNYRLYEQSKLYLSEHGQKLSQMEEAYMSRWSDKIPGVAASQRAYTTFLNRLRADSFDAMAATLSKTGKPTPVELNAIANFINVATGRGKIGLKETGSVGMNTVFFAPRYVASRFQYLLGQPLYRGTMNTRMMIAKEYARFLTGIGIVYGLGTMAGGEVGLDPRSSDFGKIKIGNTRIDPMAGLSQSTVLMGRLGTGETKTTTGKVQDIRGNIKYGGSDSADVIARFLRSKLSPVAGISVDVATGRNYVGEPVDATYAAKQFVPLAFNDIYETMKEQGVAAGTALSLLSILGVGIQTYEPKRRR